jgi:hypothetical protein
VSPAEGRRRQLSPKANPSYFAADTAAANTARIAETCSVEHVFPPL